MSTKRQIEMQQVNLELLVKIDQLLKVANETRLLRDKLLLLAKEEIAEKQAGIRGIGSAGVTMRVPSDGHKDCGATVDVKCPRCGAVATIPIDRPDTVTDRACPVCNAELPYLPAETRSTRGADS